MALSLWKKLTGSTFKEHKILIGVRTLKDLIKGIETLESIVSSDNGKKILSDKGIKSLEHLFKARKKAKKELRKEIRFLINLKLKSKNKNFSYKSKRKGNINLNDIPFAPPVKGVFDLDKKRLTLYAFPYVTEDNTEQMWLDTTEMETFFEFEKTNIESFHKSDIFQNKKNYKTMFLSSNSKPRLFITAETFLKFVLRSNKPKVIDLKKLIWKLVNSSLFSGKTKNIPVKSIDELEKIIFDLENKLKNIEKSKYLFFEKETLKIRLLKEQLVLKDRELSRADIRILLQNKIIKSLEK